MKTTAANSGPGRLFLVSTPIGNLEDISLRALRILKEADLIACEDTRQTRKLLSHFDIRTRLESYHEHNELTRAPELVIDLERGAKIALVSDAGTPIISDPGHHLVTLCHRHGIPVVPVPGASALVAALAVSGMDTGEFVFAGFLPARQSARRKELRRLAVEPRTLVFYEAPHRLVDTLEDALEILGNRGAVVAREVTKLHEEFIRGRISQLLESFCERAPRGEITLVIGAADAAAHPRGEGASTPAANLVNRIEEIMRERGIDQKVALKQAARECGLTRREAYKQWLVSRTDNSN
ncbi:MAG: 16S rRNA (cytidine(1402)-2'-O)-methyltransferase [Candidatus Acidiferrales bacterium]